MERYMNRGLELLEGRWRMLALLGGAGIVIGCLAIASAFAATMASVFFLGCLLLVSAFVHFLESLQTRGWSGFFGHALAAILYGVVGWYMVLHTAASAATLTLVIGMLLVVGGLYELVSSAITRYQRWGWSFVQGVLGVVLGILIFSHWPVSAMWVIGLFVGIDLLFRGWATLMVAMAIRDGASIRRFQRTPAGIEDRRMGLADRRIAA